MVWEVYQVTTIIVKAKPGKKPYKSSCGKSGLHPPFEAALKLESG
jgi:hypothetical protein